MSNSARTHTYDSGFSSGRSRSDTGTRWISLPNKPPTNDVAFDLELSDAENERFGGNSDGEEPECCGTITLNATAYFLATAFFLIGINVPLLPPLPSPLTGALLPEDSLALWYEGVVILLSMWGVHYLRRFGEVLFLHDYRRKRNDANLCRRVIWPLIYHSFFGLWIGWSLNYDNGYLIPYGTIFLPGVIIFLAGEVGNCVCHFLLWRLRRQPDSPSQMLLNSSQHVVPTGFMFRFISCPHYLFEIVTWFGFALAAFTLPSFIYLGVNTMTMVIKAFVRHTSYKTDFDGNEGRPEYPTSRKALIPFIF